MAGQFVASRCLRAGSKGTTEVIAGPEPVSDPAFAAKCTTPGLEGDLSAPGA